jgi:hypothetical protein
MATDDSQAPPSAEKHGGPIFGWFMFILMLFLAYALSVGPVVKIFRGGPLPATVDRLYKPLEFLYVNVSPVRTFYDWYFHVWGVK